jgi:hypothetical protein
MICHHYDNSKTLSNGTYESAIVVYYFIQTCADSLMVFCTDCR